MKPWQIKTVGRTIDSLEGNMGLSKRRSIELNDILTDALDDEDIVSTTDTMQILLEKCENYNEATYIIFALGEKAGLTIAYNYVKKQGLGHIFRKS